MRIVVAGAGEVGAHLVKMLCDANHVVTAIDRDPERLRALDSTLDVLTISGSAASMAVLESGDIRKADLFISVTEQEAVNITSAIIAKRLGAKKTIARIDNDEYLMHDNREYFRGLGIDSLIYPQKLAAKAIAGVLRKSGASDSIEFSGGKLSIVSIKLQGDAPIVGASLVDATRMLSGFDFRVVAIFRAHDTIVPDGKDRFFENDVVHVITNPAGMTELLKVTGKKRVEYKNVMILGGSRTGTLAAKDLEAKFNVKLIEKDVNKCHQLANLLNQTLIINGDGRNMDLLLEEQIASMDVFIAVTGNSETNILSCMLAKKMGVRKVVAEIENLDYIGLGENVGIDTIVNKKFMAASRIFRFTINAHVSSMNYLNDTNAEVLEFVVPKDAKITRHPLKDLDFPKGAIVGGVVRGNSTFIAKGDTLIQPNDKVIVFALGQVIDKVVRFFK